MDINEMKKCNMMELQQIHRLKEEGKSISTFPYQETAWFR